jgi:hypothetical protein
VVPFLEALRQVSRNVHAAQTPKARFGNASQYTLARQIIHYQGLSRNTNPALCSTKSLDFL